MMILYASGASRQRRRRNTLSIIEEQTFSAEKSKIHIENTHRNNMRQRPCCFWAVGRARYTRRPSDRSLRHGERQRAHAVTNHGVTVVKLLTNHDQAAVERPQ
jgi:hypothetical protein